MTIRRILVSFLALTTLAVMSGCGENSGSAEGTRSSGTTIPFNYGLPASDYYVQFVARDLGLYEKVGLKPNMTLFPSGAPILAGLKSGSLDVVTTGMGTMFALGQGIPLDIILWANSASAGTGFVVNKNSGIQNINDIAGKKLAVAAGTCAQSDMYFIAKKAGIAYEELDVVNIPPPLYSNAFKSGSIDGGVAWGPYAQMLEQEGYKVVSWASEYDPDGGACPNLTSIRSPFLKSHPDVAEKLVQVQALAVEEIRKNPQVAVDSLAKALNIPEAAAKQNFEMSWKRFPSLEEQADPKSHFSLVSDTGLANTLSQVSEALAATGSIPKPLAQDQIKSAINPQPLLNYMKSAKPTGESS